MDREYVLQGPEFRHSIAEVNLGEICITCTSMMKGYYKEDCSQVFDAETFLRTGDVGYYDKGGCIYVLERIKELGHPYIQEAYVFGIPGTTEEEPVACIVLKKICVFTEEQLDMYLKDQVRDPERLNGGVIFLESLAKTSRGKVNRQEVKEFFLKAKEGTK